MEAVKFSGMNTTYVAPGCFDLPTMAEERDGKLEVTSCWKPSAEDLEMLNAGGCVCLCVRGGQPPVALWTQNVEIVEQEEYDTAIIGYYYTAYITFYAKDSRGIGERYVYTEIIKM